MKSHSDKKTIWIVDDSPTDTLRVSKVLSAEYNLEILNDGAIALEKLTSGNLPDLLILDWMMPGISGIEVCRYIRSLGNEFVELPIILLTAQHGSPEVVEAFRSGANDYISKPFVDEELVARVSAQISTQGLRNRVSRTEKDLKSLLINAPDPIVAVDALGKITFLNDEAAKLFGGPHLSFLGKSLMEQVPEITARHIGLGNMEPLLPVPEVKIGDRIFSPSIRLLPSDDAAYTTISLRDVTARKKIESRRLDFYSIIAHDLRTPITSVLLRLQMVFRGKYGILPSGLLEDLRRTELSLKSQVVMINDFLELAKLEDMSYRIERKPVDLKALVTSIVQDFEPLIDKKKLSLKVEALNSPIVQGDYQRLSQVVANLLGNAVKFTPDEGKITISIRSADSHAELYIQDTGHGIAQNEIEHLFDRFTRTHNSAAFATGTGLGLMIVREIIEAHGGSVGVESQVGIGSKFWVWLPQISSGA
ncbi:MAG: ATP-binding protein [Bdellovibrionota bacterium]